jgi:hypothetical protein
VRQHVVQLPVEQRPLGIGERDTAGLHPVGHRVGVPAGAREPPVRCGGLVDVEVVVVQMPGGPRRSGLVARVALSRVEPVSGKDGRAWPAETERRLRERLELGGVQRVASADASAS